MAIYFKDKEITNIDHLVPQTGLDITDIWFGNINVYTVWQVYEGTLPATLNANGDDMRQYQVYGATGGVGDKTVNYFDYRNYVYGYYISSSGVETEGMKEPWYEATWLSHSDYISISPDESYTMEAHHQYMNGPQTVAIAWYDESKIFISRDSTQIPMKNAGSYSFTATAPQNAKFAIFNFFTDNVQTVMFTPGTTPPETFVPFGYKLPMIVFGGYQTYDDILPAQINANGMNFKNYRIFGAAGGVGDKTVQLFDKNATDTDNGYVSGAYIKSDGELQNSSSWFVSEYIPVNAEEQYTVVYGSQSSSRAVCYYDINKNYISGANYSGLSTQETITTPSTCAYLRLSLVLTAEDTITVTPGTTPPETFVPFGYKVDISTEKPIIYGFHINPNDSNSYTAVTYLEDAVGKTPAAMGSTAFSYGDWADTFFMPRPCMLKYDGTVDYYLNPNDYSQKADGTPSDYNNLAYGGNAMMEFPLIWYKFVQGTESGEGYFYCSNRKVDDSYKCFSNMDCDGNIIEHFYMPIYNGCTYDGKMRSISGLQLSPWSTTAYSSSSTYAVGSKVNYNDRMWECKTAVETAEAFDSAKWEQFAFNGNTTGTEEITQATANNTTAKVEWYTDVLCDRQLINALLVLLSKSLDTQGSFGRGIDSGGQTAKEAYVTGSLNDKGLFYGSTANGNTAVKVFGMENWWALMWHRIAGLVGGSNNTYLYKMTYGTSDGSTANGYNTDGTGYLSIGNRPTSNNYIKKMQYGLWGCLPIEVGPYSAQYWNDHFQNGTGYALIGGNSSSGAVGGAFYVFLDHTVGHRSSVFSSNFSCKPCGTGNLSKNLENATITPIYIGDTALQKDEYIDYQAGKVYRRTVNYFDISAQTLIDVTGTGTMRTGVYLGFLAAGQYTLTFDAPHNYSLFITRKNGNTYTYQDVNKSQLPFTFSVGSGDEIIIRTGNTLTFEQQQFTNICVTSGDTPPETYVPYYQPTDLPVSLPALPTCDGTTIVDYEGQSIVPSRFYGTYINSSILLPLYIGDNPLQDGEFIDFLKQKIYRKSQNDIDLSGQPSKPSQGVSYTVNSSTGTITASRVSSGTANSQYPISIPANVYGDLYFKACPSGGGTSRYFVFMWDRTTGARTKKHNGTSNTDNDLGNGNYLETSIVEGHETVMIIQIAQGYNADNVVFTPYIGTVNADLTPTNPPVSLPALPTCDGETIVDYVGESVTIPEKVAFKYRKKNF